VNSGPSRLEILTALHVALLGLFSSWAIGGGVGWARLVICIIGSLAPLITLAAVYEQRADRHHSPRILHTLWPLLAFNALVVFGTFQPSLRVAFIEGGNVLVPRNDLSFSPSSARPELARQALWLFDAIVLSCFNLLLAVNHRRTLRTLLLVIASNALVLAVFGSIQKFTGANGLFFNHVASPNSSFFASFIYHNHWGAFVVLMLAVCLGLLFNLRPWSGYRDFWHSPALAAVIAIFFIAVTIPLSASRSCSAIALLLLTTSLLHGLRRVAHHGRSQGKSAVGPMTAIFLTVIVAIAFLFLLARQSIETRLTDTHQQLAHMSAEGSIGGRAQLYSDTWHMARDRPWFGWGLGSYGTVFSFYNTQTSPIDKLPVYYEDAHSDWLQLFAETGAIGIAAYLLFLAAPLSTVRRLQKTSALPGYLLAGCGLILLYAWIEFPFGSPAVTIAFWTCFFCAVRWAQFDQHERVG